MAGRERAARGELGGPPRGGAPRLVRELERTMNPDGPVTGTRLLAGRCPYCHRRVLQVREHGTSRLVLLEESTAAGLELVGPNDPPGTVRGYTADGRPARVNPEAALREGDAQLTIHLAHASSCWRAAAAARGAPTRHQVPERAACRGCGAAMLWIRTVDGKRVPLDPAPRRGHLHGNGEAVPEGFQLVRGYTLEGAVLAVLEGAPSGLFQAAPQGQLATVYVTHFATCPERESFKRRPASGADRGERRT